MGPKKTIPSIKRRPKAAVLGINDKFLIISNKIEDEINKNNNFTSDIQPINIDKSYRVALTDFHYSNKIKHFQGNLKITLANSSTNEIKSHENKMQEFESILESESKKALKRLREYIKDISSFDHPNSTSFNEAIFKDVFLCLDKMVETFNNLKIYMEENKNKASSYFVGNDIKYYNDIISFIVKRYYL